MGFRRINIDVLLWQWVCKTTETQNTNQSKLVFILGHFTLHCQVVLKKMRTLKAKISRLNGNWQQLWYLTSVVSKCRNLCRPCRWVIACSSWKIPEGNVVIRELQSVTLGCVPNIMCILTDALGLLCFSPGKNLKCQYMHSMDKQGCLSSSSTGSQSLIQLIFIFTKSTTLLSLLFKGLTNTNQWFTLNNLNESGKRFAPCLWLPECVCVFLP